MKKDEIMERKVDENLKKALKNSEYWRHCYKTTPEKELERYLIVYHNTNLYDINEKEVNKYAGDMWSQENLELIKDKNRFQKHLEWYIKIAPSQMARNLARNELEKIKGGE